ncbi:MAG: SRPBCC family protein [Bacteroidota bacterium]
MSNNSVALHRVIKTSPEKLFRAFTDPLAMAAWLPPYGYLCTVHEMNATVGGHYRASFQNFTTGNSHTFGGEFIEIRTNEFLKYTDQFEDPNMPGKITTTVWLTKTSVGTELKVEQTGIPAAIPAEMCYLGWQDSLDKLTKLVEPVIQDM